MLKQYFWCSTTRTRFVCSSLNIGCVTISCFLWSRDYCGRQCGNLIAKCIDQCLRSLCGLCTNRGVQFNNSVGKSKRSAAARDKPVVSCEILTMTRTAGNYIWSQPSPCCQNRDTCTPRRDFKLKEFRWIITTRASPCLFGF